MRLQPCSVTIVTLDRNTGKVLSSKLHSNTAIAYLIDESDKKCLVVGVDEKTSQEFPVAGGVKIHARFVHEGKATFTLVRRNINLMISKAEPAALKVWVQSCMSGRPPPPSALQQPAAADAAPSQAAPSNRPVSAPPKRHLAPATPARINAVAASSGSPAANPAAAKMGRAPGGSPAWAGSPKQQLTPNATKDLTEQQQDVLRDVVLGGKSVFFTGGAGVGKTHLLKRIVSRLDPRATYVTASTGLAACAIGGVTVHHWAGIGGGADRSIEAIVDGARRKRGLQWRSAKTLVIDEVSMLDGDLFDLLELVARRVRDDPRPFGGLQLVLCGDFFQLPPVAKAGSAFKFAFEAATWKACVPRVHELTKVFRQADTRLVDALNRIRKGEAPPEVRSLLRPCEGRKLAASADGIAATRVTTHKADCARLNADELAKLPGERFTFRARDEGRDAEALATLRGSCPAEAELTLKVGAQVLLLKTLDAPAGLVNGARGVVVKFLPTRNPLVKFDNGIERSIRCEAFALSQAGLVVACRMQVPLGLGWAISVHKSQGMTLDRCELALKNVFESGQMYVALSRCRSLEGLALRDIDWSKCRAHPSVLAWHRDVVESARSDAAAVPVS